MRPAHSRADDLVPSSSAFHVRLPCAETKKVDHIASVDVGQHGVYPRGKVDGALGPPDLGDLDHKRPESKVKLDHPIQVLR